MAEVDIRFEREDRDGVVAVGTYLYDAATRLGIRFDEECQRLGESDACAVEIKEGAELLSEPTQAEIEQLSEERRKKGERLACQAKLEKSGEVVIMTKEKVAEEQPKTEKTKEEFKKEFEDMPLEEKISSLLELEAMALSDTLSFVMNTPYAVANKVMDVMADFGQKIEKETKKATRPEEHRDEETEEQAEAKEEAKKNGAKASNKKTTKTASAKKTTAKKKTTTAKKKEEDKTSEESEE